MTILLMLLFLWHVPAIYYTAMELIVYLRDHPDPDHDEFLEAYDSKYIGDYEGFFMITYLTMGIIACAIIFLLSRLSGILLSLLIIIILWITLMVML
jgi:hypothetical protein